MKPETLEFISPSSAKDIKSPIVYALGNEAFGIVYVGKTCNPRKRFAIYVNNKDCHNKELSEWLSVNEWGVRVLAVNPENIDDVEESFIRAHWGKTFNKVKSSRLFHEGNKNQPWSATTGVRCPSDQLLRLLSMGSKDRSVHNIVRAARKPMLDVERCLFEIRVAEWMDVNLPGMGQQVGNWLQKAYPKMERLMIAEIRP